MPDWVIGALVTAGTDIALVAIGALVVWGVHRWWGVRGLAWLLGKTESEVRGPPPGDRGD